MFDFDPDRHLDRLEASTDYTKAPFVTGVWDRMTAAPDVEVKLLCIMRHPLRRLESHARHVQVTRKEIGQQISPRPDHGLETGLSPVSLSASLYASQLDQFSTAHAAGQLYCLTLEGLKADPKGTMEGVYDFLGLDSGAAEEELPVSNPASAKARAHPLWRAAMRIRPLMALARGLLPEAMREKLKSRFRRQVKAEGRFHLTPAEEAALTTIYASDLARLRDVYGIDTGTLWEIDPPRR